MSYRCALCNTAIPAGQSEIKIVTSWREKYYPFRPKANPGYVLKRGEVKKSNRNADRADDPGGQGKEIAREVSVCAECAKPFQQPPAE